MNRRPWLSLFVAVTGLALLGHCSKPPSTTDAGTPDAGNPAIHQGCLAQATNRCEKELQCAPYSFYTTYGTNPTACFDAQTESCDLNRRIPGDTATPERLQNCAEAWVTQDCEDFYVGKQPAACTFPAGAAANGSSCAVPSSCNSVFCAIPTSSLCGTCQDPALPGSPCQAQSDCGSGYTCDTTRGVCVTPSWTQGATCTTAGDCGSQLFGCYVPAGMDAGTCVPSSQTPGTHCNLRDGGTFCSQARGEFCDSKGDFTCHPITYAGTGEPCGYLDAGQKVACLGQGFCPGDGGASLCVAAAQVGSACDAVLGPHCVAPARCIQPNAASSAGTCQLPDPASCY